MTMEERAQNVRSLARSFIFSFWGIGYCIRNERNMRIHLVMAAYVLVFSCFYGFSPVEYAVLLLSIALVIASETMNTAIEAIVNLQTQCYDNLARIAKDVAAGAVFICAFFAAVIGCVFFIKPKILLYIVAFLVRSPLYGIIFLLSIPAATLFIFCFPFRGRIRSRH